MADTDQVLILAAIIRMVDGSHSKGAAALAESILDHPGFYKCCNVPAPPADGEVAELVTALRGIAYWKRYGKPGATPVPFDIRQADRLDRAAELLQRQVLVPVSVSERLPGPKDCNAEGKCWLCGKVEGDWRLINPEKSGVPHLKYCFTHWLPAHALPLPEVNNG